MTAQGLFLQLLSGGKETARCNFCDSEGACFPNCECAKGLDPQSYDEWKHDEDGNYTPQYKTWLLKQAESEDEAEQIAKEIYDD